MYRKLNLNHYNLNKLIVLKSKCNFKIMNTNTYHMFQDSLCNRCNLFQDLDKLKN